jgi:hypothetical protein
MLEKTIKAAVRKRLKELGAYQFWSVPFGLGTSTVDCLVCYRGFFIAIETKAPGIEPTARQVSVIAEIRKAGGRAMVIDDLEKVRIFLSDDNLPREPDSSTTA